MPKSDPIAEKAYKAEYNRLNKDKLRTLRLARIRQRTKEVQAIKLERGCERCGYRKCAAALDFHHRDPSQKCFQLARAIGKGTKMSRILEEIAKCDVICGNCHEEEHHANMGH